MENKTNLFVPLLEKAVEYGNTSFELLKLKALEKTTEVVSSGLSDSIILIFMATFALMFNVGLALWLGEILGKIYLGFFAVAALYGVIAMIVRVFMYKWFKKIFSNKFIKYVLK